MKTGRIWRNSRVEEVLWDHNRLIAPDGELIESDQWHWLAPVVPRNIIGLALNYGSHATELGLDEPPEPALFFKPTSTVIGHQAAIRYPRGVTYCHYETEVAVVMGRRCHRVSAVNALDYVAGYTVANDFTCRDFIRNTFRPPVRAKGVDSFCPLGPFLVSADEIPDPNHLHLTTEVNGDRRQEGNTAHLTYAIPEIIAYLSSFMTLDNGDVILTGTPEGISPVFPGDVIACRVEGLGTLINPVREEGYDGELKERQP